MTIRGSAVQEDASSGIWELTETGDGIKLTVSRAKGKGRGNYRRFKLMPFDLDGHDSYGDPLQGIVPVNFGGTEDEGRADRIQERWNKRRALAKAVIGALEVYPSENPDDGCSNNVTSIAQFLTRMWLNRKSDYDAAGFTADWMDLTDKYGIMDNIITENNFQQIRKDLVEEFMDGSDNQPVIIGEYALGVEQKGTSKKLRFVIKDSEKGPEE